MNNTYDLIIIGGGQSALATAYFLRRSGLNYIILDEQEAAGGAWRHTWDSLKLFSPGTGSSLPGRLWKNEDYPTRAEVLAYLEDYEARYDLPVLRPVAVTAVRKSGDIFELETSQGAFRSRAVISATGTWKAPYIPDYPGSDLFRGQQLHSAWYRRSADFAGQSVLIVGGGNSGAQILAEVSKVATTTWITESPPLFLPDEVDGRYLFNVASAKYQATRQGAAWKADPALKKGLSAIVMVDSVKEARDRGVLGHRPPFARFEAEGVVWEDGSRLQVDSVIWCTGFKAALEHLAPLDLQNAKGRIAVKGTRAQEVDGLWLVGYGGWTGYASATLIGVGRTARATVNEVIAYLAES